MALTDKQKDRLLELQNKIMEIQEELEIFWHKVNTAEPNSEDADALEYCYDKLDDAYMKLGHFG